jgi:hypothetical protein
MSDAPRFCVDCKHHVLAVSTEGHLWWKQTVVRHRCVIPSKQPPDLVTGHAQAPTDRNCHEERAYFHITDCGIEGRLWEPQA